MTIRDLLAGGAASALPLAREWRYFPTTRTFTPDVDIDCNLHLIGGAATGGFACGSYSTLVQATGGQAGTYVKKRTTLKAGITYTFTVGAGGTLLANATGMFSGGNGGDTSVVGTGLNVVAGGGKGGKASAGTAALDGGTGGTGSGGDVIRPGGRGGNIVAGATGTGVYRSTGGGAVNFLGEPCNGGDISVSVNYGSSPNQSIGTGGGGIGGAGLPQNGSPGGNAAIGSNGGGVGIIAPGGSSITMPSRPLFGIYDTIGPGGSAGGITPGNGGGAGTSGGGSQQPNFLGGQGGVARADGAASFGGSAPGIGGGGGGVACQSPSGSWLYGGNGYIFMEILG